MRNLLLLVLLSLGCVCYSSPEVTLKTAKKCLFINSYHKGYQWSDGIETAARKILQGQCSVETFYMDTKNHDSVDYARKKGLEVRDWIKTRQADLVIVSDDAAVEYVLEPYFKNDPMPFVFCGINWEATKYGLPYKNATGMIEIAPVERLLEQALGFLPHAKSALYLSGDVRADRDNHEIYSKTYRKAKIKLDGAFAKNMDEWEKLYVKAQSYDFIIIANYVGIADWSEERAKKVILQSTRKLTITFHDFMVPYVGFSLTKSAEEQGEWAAKVAVEILQGANPNSFPVAVNRRWNSYVNDPVLRLSPIKIPQAVRRMANKVAL